MKCISCCAVVMGAAAAYYAAFVLFPILLVQVGIGFHFP
jgi:hypothetical protein